MASSSCSHLHMFKPMARFHLPFSSLEETQVRSIGMYLISEYIKQLDNPDHKIDIAGLRDKYEMVSKVNQGIIKRVRALKGGDANKNAIIILDNFASFLPSEIASGFSEIKGYFTEK